MKGPSLPMLIITATNRNHMHTSSAAAHGLKYHGDAWADRVYLRLTHPQHMEQVKKRGGKATAHIRQKLTSDINQPSSSARWRSTERYEHRDMSTEI
jgi:hypothetical protein